MKLQGIRIRNFKGIKSCQLDLRRAEGARVYSLIGLNESGKTTILEAINAFSVGEGELSSVYEGVVKQSDIDDFVPKSQKSNFNGISGIALDFLLEDVDIKKLLDYASKELGLVLDKERLKKQFYWAQRFNFKESVHSGNDRILSIEFWARTKKGRVFREVDGENWKKLAKILRESLPSIYYFPTFLFNLPDRIVLEPSPNETRTNAYYRSLLQDVFGATPNKLNVDSHIVKRIRSAKKEEAAPFSWLTARSHHNWSLVEAARMEASEILTKVVFESWRNVFQRSFTGKRIEIDINFDETSNQIYAHFVFVDGASKYELSERSLGFRWFFCFLLFTRFRAMRDATENLIFLFDEPASNLHGRAQAELLASFEKVASDRNIIIYSTHSHYLIEPRWLDGAFIVSNRALEDEDEMAMNFVNVQTEVQVETYRNFVGQNPERSSHFLPVLEALDYAPSGLEISGPAAIVEGKCDFAFLRLVQLSGNICTQMKIIPATGATTYDTLISLLTGWGQKFCCLLDDDHEGKEASKKYKERWGLCDSECFTLAEVEQLKGKSLEVALSSMLAPKIKLHFNSTTSSKKQLQAYLQEALSKNDPDMLTPEAIEMGRELLEFLDSKILSSV